VIERATEPLLLVGPRGEDTWSRAARRLVVCIDGTVSSLAATRHACEWAQTLGLEVQLVFATHPLDVEDTEHPDEIFAPYAEIVRAAGLEVHRNQLFRSAFIGGALADFAEDPPATLIVMAAHHHSVLARAALGSTTMSVLNVSSCPVLVVPPGAK
jgi:nucleotide-binding universal stress UspA family protein